MAERLRRRPVQRSSDVRGSRQNVSRIVKARVALGGNSVTEGF